mmetsp:Transcript_56275/g.131856  ORF Transcript_56275/g.131856 Transcript_56275/m.131856 type:complete len:129 (-) Transcript_56275:109-495(-)
MGATCCTNSDVATGESFKVEVAPAVLEARSADSGSELVFTFGLPDGKTQDVVFQRRPLGLDFDKSMPLVVRKVHPNQHAEELGVQSGWKILRVNGQSIETATFDECFKLLKEASGRLPEVKKAQAEIR